MLGHRKRRRFTSESQHAINNISDQNGVNGSNISWQSNSSHQRSWEDKDSFNTSVVLPTNRVNGTDLEQMPTTVTVATNRNTGRNEVLDESAPVFSTKTPVLFLDTETWNFEEAFIDVYRKNINLSSQTVSYMQKIVPKVVSDVVPFESTLASSDSVPLFVMDTGTGNFKKLCTDIYQRNREGRSSLNQTASSKQHIISMRESFDIPAKSPSFSSARKTVPVLATETWNFKGRYTNIYIDNHEDINSPSQAISTSQHIGPAMVSDTVLSDSAPTSSDQPPTLALDAGAVNSEDPISNIYQENRKGINLSSHNVSSIRQIDLEVAIPESELASSTRTVASVSDIVNTRAENFKEPFVKVYQKNPEDINLSSQPNITYSEQSIQCDLIRERKNVSSNYKAMKKIETVKPVCLLCLRDYHGVLNKGAHFVALSCRHVCCNVCVKNVLCLEKCPKCKSHMKRRTFRLYI